MDTVIEVVAAPVFQASVPVKLPAVNKDVPQLFVTFTVGVEGIGIGAAVLLPGRLTHPVETIVCVTE